MCISEPHFAGLQTTHFMLLVHSLLTTSLYLTLCYPVWCLNTRSSCWLSTRNNGQLSDAIRHSMGFVISIICHQHSFCLKGGFCLRALPQEAWQQGTGGRRDRLHPTVTSLGEQLQLTGGRLFQWGGQRDTLSLALKARRISCLAEMYQLLGCSPCEGNGASEKRLRGLQQELSSTSSSPRWDAGMGSCVWGTLWAPGHLSAGISESWSRGSWSLTLPEMASEPVLRRNVCRALGYLPPGPI